MPIIQRSNTKAPAEVRDVSYDFSAELASGETITGQNVNVYYNTSPPTAANAGGDLVASGVTLFQGTLVTCVLSQGVFGTDYLVTFTAVTSAGQIIPRSVYQSVGQT
jgi:hypothetical protein